MQPLEWPPFCLDACLSSLWWKKKFSSRLWAFSVGLWLGWEPPAGATLSPLFYPLKINQSCHEHPEMQPVSPLFSAFCESGCFVFGYYRNETEGSSQKVMPALFVSLLKVNFEMCFAILAFLWIKKTNNKKNHICISKFDSLVKWLTEPTAPPQVWSSIPTVTIKCF